MVDSNPLADVEAHPDKSGNAIDLGGRTEADWCAALGEALTLIGVGLPGWSGELPQALQRIVPVGFEAQQHLSASYKDAPGLAYLSLHPDPLTMAEAVVHETQHSKLNTLLWLDPVLHNARTEWTSSPIRPDMRPLIGVLLAAHAFVPVSALHHGLQASGHPVSKAPGFVRRQRQVLESNRDALATVAERGRFTPAGKRVFEALQALQQHCTAT
jgi:HEXXH motif-containing protein